MRTTDHRSVSAPARDPAFPEPQGLYDPAREHDSCGVGFVADIHNRRSHAIIRQGLEILKNLTHRGAVGADPNVGDGAGLLIQIPHRFFAAEAERLGFELPAPGDYAVGHVFMPPHPEGYSFVEAALRRIIEEEEQIFLGLREVPKDNSGLSESVRAAEPRHLHVFIGRSEDVDGQDEFERRLYVIRKMLSSNVYAAQDPRTKGFYVASLSSRTLVYKGMFLSHQLAAYYSDLSDEHLDSAMALVHQRFSTNTFPTWTLAHPYRMVAHNGEINTLRGNVNWMAARQASVSSDLLGPDIRKLWPISYEGQSDTACFDNALEFLVMGGYPLAHAMTMLVPEAWAGNPLMDEERRAFYQYHAALMEPWDGPAALAFSDGRQIGATLDRNGLRPARYFVTDDGLVVMASEMGVLPEIPEEKIVLKDRLRPGRMLLIDLEQGRIVSDHEIKTALAKRHPYRSWVSRTEIVLEDLPSVARRAPVSSASLLDRQQAFGYTQEDLRVLMAPMAVTGQEAIGSMGTDTPIAALSNKSKLLYSYFKQNFAQVTNPPIDPIREDLVMSLVSFIGPRPNLFDLKGQSKRKRLLVRQPILTNPDLEKIRAIGEMNDNHFRTETLDITYAIGEGSIGMKPALDRLCAAAERAVGDGYNIVILSDRKVDRGRVAVPALLATAAVHNYLIYKGLRTSVGLVVESGEPREAHHFCALAGYGAEAINPYLAFETLAAAKATFPEEVSDDEIVYRTIKAIDKGLLKVMSKMGISTYQSYCGAQIFDAVGLASDFVRRYFFGTATTIEGVGLKEIAEETVRRHRAAFGDDPVLANALETGGEYAYRKRGEDHVWTPDSVASLQHAVRGEGVEKYRDYLRLVESEDRAHLTVRGLLRLRAAEEMGRAPVPLDEVEPASEIMKRFATGAMSFGSISREAHTTLAVAMNRMKAKSNTGEGGEEADRYPTLENGDSLRSAIKQVASGRFGVTTEYLVNSDVMQIKIAQGAKPGEGGQLPGHKVDAVIAKVRHSTAGVQLISPPPHHDIYSIEDLAQLIFDLKNVNPSADVSVKLVSEVGVGTVAAGVTKARADHITISGYEGGTGASPLTSIKHAGSPWEMGLAETHQTLVLNGLRGRVALQVDGGLRTGRDVAVAAMLGADEFGFATAPLIAVGCLMMRKCHLNTCPVGIATQDPVLRARFKGTPEDVINFFWLVAEDVRGIMAGRGVRRFEDLIGATEFLVQKPPVAGAKAQAVDLSRLLTKPNAPGAAVRHVERQNHPIANVLDRELIRLSWGALEHKRPVRFERTIANSDRSTGAMLSGEVARRYGHAGLPDDTIVATLRGTAGQSFGAWTAAGVTLDLIGEANDYVGKGLSGGRLVVRPSEASGIVPEESAIIGNTALYGAISGEAYFRGIAGERFAVRNSGAVTVAEGVGDHGCEYMTGGVVVVIGPTGRNFAAGMSGGVAYVLDETGDFARRCNLSMVELEPVIEEADLLERLHRHGPDIEFHGLVDVLSDMTRHDEERILQLLASHRRYTGSTKAQAIMDHWHERRSQFVKVMPVEYRKAIEILERDRGEARRAAAGE